MSLPIGSNKMNALFWDNMNDGRIAKTPPTKDFKFVKIKIHLKRESLN